HCHQVIDKSTVLVQRRTSLRDYEFALVDSRQKIDFVSNTIVHYLTVGTLQKAIRVGASIGSQRVDQTNVRTLRGFNRAHASVVSRMHVTHLETGTLTSQTAWSKSRYAALVG